MSFSNSSRNIQLNGSILSADCATSYSSTGWKKSTLDLDGQIQNRNGNLERVASTSIVGLFSITSRNIQLNGATLTAQSQNTYGNWVSASINLDRVVKNQDGVLVWV